MKALSLLTVLSISLASTAWGPMARAQGETIHIVDATSRPTPPGIRSGVVYLTLMNHGAADDTLTGISTPVAERAELDRDVNQNGIAKMTPVTDFSIKANDGVTFKAGGLHIMLIGLNQNLKPGQTFPVTLTFAKAGPVDITVKVQPLAAAKSDMSVMPGMKM